MFDKLLVTLYQTRKYMHIKRSPFDSNGHGGHKMLPSVLRFVLLPYSRRHLVKNLLGAEAYIYMGF